MKNTKYMFVLFALLVSKASAQNISYVIKGELVAIEQSIGNKFAYLYIFEASDTSKSVISSPIINGKFNIENESSLNGKLCLSGAIFLHDAKINDQRALHKLYEEKRDKNMARIIYIEDLAIEVNDTNLLKYAVVNGGKLNKDRDEMNKAIMSEDYENFFNSHRDSPISISFLLALWKTTRLNGLEIASLKRIYNGFSDRLKNSQEAKKITDLF